MASYGCEIDVDVGVLKWFPGGTIRNIPADGGGLGACVQCKATEDTKQQRDFEMARL